MFDAKKLLDQFLGAGGLEQFGSGGQSHGQPAPRRAPVPTTSTGGGGSGDLLGKVRDLAGGNLGGVAGGAIAGTLASVLLGGAGGKKSPQLSGSAMKLGGLAILGGLAYKAWLNHQEKQGAPAQTPPAPQPGPVAITPPPASTPFTPSNAGEEQRLGLLLVRAMIAAARSDGRIDGEEIGRIREALKAAGAGADEQSFLLEHLGQPDDLDSIAAEARGPELASEVWLAARLTIQPDTPAEQAFLRALADKLGLGAPLVAHLEATAEQARQSGVTAA